MERTVVYVIRGKGNKVERADMKMYDALCMLSRNVIVYLCGDYSPGLCGNAFQKHTKLVYKSTREFSDCDVLRELVEQDELSGDELVFANNSMIGPFFSLQSIFEKMDSKNADCWVLTRVGERIAYDWRILPEHLQLNFLVVKKRMLQADTWKSFLKNEIPVEHWEVAFTTFVKQEGFTWLAYINIERYNDATVTNNVDLLHTVSYELLKDYQYPFLVKDYFCTKNLENHEANDLQRSVAYIAEQGLYDMDIFWECILHEHNVVDIKNSMNLCYILPEQSVCDCEVTEEDYKRTVIILHIGYMESVETVKDYLKDVPRGITVLIVVLNDTIKECMDAQLEECKNLNYEIRVMSPNRGRDMNALFVTCKDAWEQFDYLCFTHDKRTSGATGAYTVGKTFMDILWENTVKSGGYITNVLDTLKKDKYLGYLTVPAPYHAGYFKTMGDAWGKSYTVTKELADQLGLSVPIEENKQPFALGNGFWCKTDALKDIVNYELKTDDFHAEPMPSDGTISHGLERVMIYAAQNRGYYSGVVESISYAQTELSNKSYVMQRIMEKSLSNPMYSARTTFDRYLDKLQDKSFEDFLRRYSKVYIWGAGKSGYDIYYNLKKIGFEISGYICSDGYAKPEAKDLPVYYLSEVDVTDSEIGIILAVHKKFYYELLNTIERLGDKVYCL